MHGKEVNMGADLDGIIVKYHAYLRKMTRYNPTRGGKLYHKSADSIASKWN